MSFLHPLGLIGLAGVPLLIIIYILRSKYNEQTVPSTFLWTLSERFFKRRNPLSGLTGLISLILQILMVIFASLAIARPVFVIPESASEYCFVLDGSGSMNATEKGESCFEKGREEIKNMIKDARLGSSFTLIYASTDTSVVYERLSDKDMAIDMLYELECSDGSVEYTRALNNAQKYFDENNSTLIYFVTDKGYVSHENVEIVNVGLQKSVNYSISEVWGNLSEGTLYAGGVVTSHTTAATVTVELYVNNSQVPAATKKVALTAGESADVELSCKATSYDSFRLCIKESDNLLIDNEVTSYNLNSEASYSILLVSETPFFYEAALDALTDSVVDVISPEEYNGQKGYGLYIFHTFTPDTLPEGAVWLINCSESIPDSGFGVRGIMSLEDPGKIVKSESTASRARQLLSGVSGKDIYISEYVKYSGMYTQFTTLFSYDSNPLIFAGVNGLGNRQVVFGFDIHKSDLALSPDFVALLSNLLKYSCPDVVDHTDFVSGEQMDVNITANIDSVKVISPDGEENYLDTSADMSSITLSKVGTYTIKVVSLGSEKTYKVFAQAPVAESNPSEIGDDFSVYGARAYEKTDGQYDPIVLLFILLAVTFAADWMVYCYEKYQLR